VRPTVNVLGKKMFALQELFFFFEKKKKGSDAGPVNALNSIHFLNSTTLRESAALFS